MQVLLLVAAVLLGIATALGTAAALMSLVFRLFTRLRS